MTIGICDWGIGGLGFYKLLREHRSDVDVVYLGDQGEVPYGRVPKPLLAARMEAVLPLCRERGTTIVTNMGAANPSAAAVVVQSRIFVARPIPGLKLLVGSSPR